MAATRAAAITATVDDVEIGPRLRGAFAEIDASLAASGVRPSGPAAGLYDTDLFALGRGSATVFVPVIATLPDIGRVRIIELPDTPDPQSWSTEIGWPIFHPGTSGPT